MDCKVGLIWQRIFVMAMRPSGPRKGERGLSIIEALVILTITSLLTLLLLPIVSRAASRNYSLADQTLDDADFAHAEAQFRMLLRSAEQHGEGASASGLEGQSDSLQIYPGLARGVSCASSGAGRAVRLRIFQSDKGGSLICESDFGRSELLSWAQGAARLHYSRDGGSWYAEWSDRNANSQSRRGGAAPVTHMAPLVKFELTRPDGRMTAWTMRAGWTEPTHIAAQGGMDQERSP